MNTSLNVASTQFSRPMPPPQAPAALAPAAAQAPVRPDSFVAAGSGKGRVGADVGTLKSWSLDVTGTPRKPQPTGDQVKPQDIPRADWNMFVYLDADNNLEKYGKDDLNEMEKVGSMEGKMNVFALVDGARGYASEQDGWKDSTRLMWIQKDPNDSQKIVSKEVWVDPQSDLGKLMAAGQGELNLGDPKVMNAALRYVQEQIPSNNLMVDMWDHGDGWKLCSSDDSGDNLSPVEGELKKALEGVKVDVLGFDECLMATKEIADIARAAGAKYLIGSEHTEPGEGWNYRDLLGRYQEMFEGDEPVTAERLAKAVVSSYVAGGKDNANMSATDLEKLPELSSRLDVLADAIAASGGFKNPVVKAALAKAHRADYDSDQMDIGHFAKLLAQSAPEGEIKDAAVALAQAVGEACFNQAPDGGIAKDSTGLTVYTPRGGMSSEYVSNEENPWVGTRWTALIQSQESFRAPPAKAPRAQYPHPLRTPRANEWFL